MIRQLINSSPLVASLLGVISLSPVMFGASPVLAQMMHSPMNKPTMMTTPNPSNVMLSRGSQGEMVSQVQTMLKQQGFYNGSINGMFDQATESAVMAFQRSHQLKVDGIVGSQTMMVMSRSRS